MTDTTTLPPLPETLEAAAAAAVRLLREHAEELKAAHTKEASYGRDWGDEDAAFAAYIELHEVANRLAALAQSAQPAQAPAPNQVESHQIGAQASPLNEHWTLKRIDKDRIYVEAKGMASATVSVLSFDAIEMLLAHMAEELLAAQAPAQPAPSVEAVMWLACRYASIYRADPDEDAVTLFSRALRAAVEALAQAREDSDRAARYESDVAKQALADLKEVREALKATANIAHSVQQSHEWGYRDPVEGGFNPDNAPFDLAAAVEALARGSEMSDFRELANRLHGETQDALIQQAIQAERAEAAQPVAWLYPDGAVLLASDIAAGRAVQGTESAQPLYAAPVAEAAQTESLENAHARGVAKGFEAGLRAAAAQRVPLTDGEVDAND